MVEYSKKYKIALKLATNSSLVDALDSMCDFWFCKPEDIQLVKIHENLFQIVKNGKTLEPMLWRQDKRCGNSIVPVWHFCKLA